MNSEHKLVIFTDGGSRGNPGESAIGVVIYDGHKNILKSYAETIGVGTNNEAEYQAVISALKTAKHILGGEKAKKTEIEVRSDSQLLVNQLSGKFKISTDRIKFLFVDVWNLKQDFKGVVFRHIRREDNVDADRLLNLKLDEMSGKGKLF